MKCCHVNSDAIFSNSSSETAVPWQYQNFDFVPIATTRKIYSGMEFLNLIEHFSQKCGQHSI